MYIRHGDVLIIPADELRTEGLKKHHESVLLEGEVTGHAHRLPETVDVWRKEEPQLDEAFWLGAFEVKEDTPLSHEEHDTITLKPGFYRHYGQREYDPVEEHMVQD